MKLAAAALFWAVDSSYYNNSTIESGIRYTLELFFKFICFVYFKVLRWVISVYCICEICYFLFYFGSHSSVNKSFDPEYNQKIKFI